MEPDPGEAVSCIVCGAPALESHLSEAGVCQNCIAHPSRWMEAAQRAKKRYSKRLRKLSDPEKER